MFLWKRENKDNSDDIDIMVTIIDISAVNVFENIVDQLIPTNFNHVCVSVVLEKSYQSRNWK